MIIMHSDLKRRGEKVIKVYFKPLYWHLPERTIRGGGRNHLSGFWLKF